MSHTRLFAFLVLAAPFFFPASDAAAAEPISCYPQGIRSAGEVGDAPANSSYFRATHINATPLDRAEYTTDVTVWRVRCSEFGDTPVVALKLKPFRVTTPFATQIAPIISVRQNGRVLGSLGARQTGNDARMIQGFEDGFRWKGFWFRQFTESYVIDERGDGAAPLVPNAGVQFDAAAPFELLFGENADSPDYVAHVPAENQPGNMTLSVDVKGFWWNPQQPGWGLGLDRNEAGIVFAIWNTYDENNRPISFVMPNGASAGINRVSGAAHLVTGPFYGQPFDPKAVHVGDPVGKFTIQFNDDTTGTFDWTIGEKSGSTPLTRFITGPRWRIIDGFVDRRGAWWNPSESGWGLVIDHGERPNVTSGEMPYMFAIWYVYGADGKMTWFVAPDTRKAAISIANQPWIGPIYWPTGSYYGAAYEPGRFTLGARVGTFEMVEATVFYHQPATGGSYGYGPAPVAFKWTIDVGAGTFSGTKQYMPFRY